MISFSVEVHFVDSTQMDMCMGERVHAYLHSMTTLVNPGTKFFNQSSSKVHAVCSSSNIPPTC